MNINELKKCPLCNSNPQRVDMLYNDEISHKDGVACSNEKCPLHQPFYLHEWQTRPIEDELLEALIDTTQELTTEIVRNQHCSYEIAQERGSIKRARSIITKVKYRD
jgi:hypothetical protein